MKLYQLIVQLYFVVCTALLCGQNLTVTAGEKESIFLEWQFDFGSIGADAGQFKNPQALSIDPEGKLYICDTENNRIQKLDQKGRFIKQIGGFGWEREQFYQPMDIHAGSALDVFIADYQNHRVERYDRELNYISSLHAQDTWEEKFQFLAPVAVAFSKQSELFLIDDENHRVVKINSYGDPEMLFGDFSWGKGQLEHPRQIEIAHDERIFITDEAVGAILIYDYFGNYLTKWGQTILSKPTGLFWDDRGLLFVTDSGNRHFFVFNSNGDLLGSSRQIKTFHLAEPVDIVAKDQFVYVLDAQESRVHVLIFKIN